MGCALCKKKSQQESCGQAAPLRDTLADSAFEIMSPSTLRALLAEGYYTQDDLVAMEEEERAELGAVLVADEMAEVDEYVRRSGGGEE